METHSHNISYHDDSPFHTGIMAFIATNGTSDSTCYNNFSFTGMAEFRENSVVEGGAIKSEYNDIIIFDGIICFDENTADDGGAIHLGSTLKLILSPAIKNLSFTHNHAESNGGALYFEDSQCSLESTRPIECFLSIFYSNSSARNISLFFLNNSSDSIGSVDCTTEPIIV